VLVLYAGLTLGAQAVSAAGVGVAKAPKTAHDTVYVGVRLDHSQLADADLLAQVRKLGGSVVVDADAARNNRHALELLAARGVDIANGGMGHGSFLRWNRAHNDVAKAGKLLAAEAGYAPHEFCPGRRVDAFDQYYAHGQRQKLVVANRTMRPENLPTHLQDRKVYLLDGRQRDDTAMEVAITDLAHQAEHDRLHVAAYGELR
jgi:hypothetical protein